jgi:hypothetical protein
MLSEKLSETVETALLGRGVITLDPGLRGQAPTERQRTTA